MRAAVPVVMRAAWQRSRCHMGLRRPLRTAAISTRMADVVVPGTEAPAGAAPEEDGKTPADMDRLNGFVDGPSVAFWRAPSRPSLAGRRRAPGPGVSAHPGPWWPCTDAGRIGTRRASTPSQTFPATWHRCSRPPSASQSGLLSLCPFPPANIPAPHSGPRCPRATMRSTGATMWGEASSSLGRWGNTLVAGLAVMQ